MIVVMQAPVEVAKVRAHGPWHTALQSWQMQEGSVHSRSTCLVLTERLSWEGTLIQKKDGLAHCSIALSLSIYKILMNTINMEPVP